MELISDCHLPVFADLRGPYHLRNPDSKSQAIIHHQDAQGPDEAPGGTHESTSNNDRTIFEGAWRTGVAIHLRVDLDLDSEFNKLSIDQLSTVYQYLKHDRSTSTKKAKKLSDYFPAHEILQRAQHDPDDLCLRCAMPKGDDGEECFFAPWSPTTRSGEHGDELRGSTLPRGSKTRGTYPPWLMSHELSHSLRAKLQGHIPLWNAHLCLMPVWQYRWGRK